MKPVSGQAGVEALVMYGAVILVAGGTIILLANVGTFNPAPVSKQAYGFYEVVPKDWEVYSATNKVLIRVENNGFDELNITGATASLNDDVVCSLAASQVVAPNEGATLELLCPEGAIAGKYQLGSSYSADVVVGYTRLGDSVPKESKGKFVGQIQDKGPAVTSPKKTTTLVTTTTTTTTTPTTTTTTTILPSSTTTTAPATSTTTSPTTTSTTTTASTTTTTIPAGAYPDLVITSISYYSPTAETPVIGGYVGYKISFLNNGTAAANGPFTVSAWFNGNPLRWERYSDTFMIEPGGETVDTQYTYTNFTAYGENVILVMVDSGMEVAESIEGNNVATLKVFIGSPTTTTSTSTTSTTAGSTTSTTQPCTCNETDGGLDFYVKGTVSYGPVSGKYYYSVTDKCNINNGDLFEEYCGENPCSGYSRIYNCSYGCWDGVCMTKETAVMCTDSDGGKNYSVKGTVWWGIPGVEGNYSTDYCVDGIFVMEQFCSNGSDFYLVEVPDGEGYRCPGACEDGRCVETNVTKPKFTCTDTDGGLNYAVKGSLNGTYADGKPLNYTDKCYGVYIDEWYCDYAGGYPSGYYTSCVNLGFTQCVNGACVTGTTSSTITTTTSATTTTLASSCSDSDGGSDYYVRGTVVWGPVNGSYYNATDACYANNSLAEYFCDNATRTGRSSAYNCPYGCSIAYGRCIVGGTTTTTTTTTTTSTTTTNPFTCSDSDGGLSYYVRGSAYWGSPEGGYFNYTDYCLENGTLMERYCDNATGFALQVSYNCPYGCDNTYKGRCLVTPGTCSDSDGGKNYSVKGTTTWGSAETYVHNLADACNLDNTYVYEHYCDESGYGNEVLAQCLYGCLGGVCMPSPSTTTTTTTSTSTTVAPLLGWCYQESANAATSCGGLGSGTYSCSGFWTKPNACANVYDTDYSSYGSGSPIAALNITYYKPAGASQSSLWQVKDYAGLVNLSIPPACWNYYYDKVVFKIYSFSSGSSHWTEFDCFNAYSWEWMSLRRVDGDRHYDQAYEEGMWWNLTTMNTSTSNGTCTCTDTDAGIDYYVKGTVTISPRGDTYTDSCNNDNGAVFEKWCGEKPFCGVISISYDCPYGCWDGACMTKETAVMCTDSDGGKNYSVNGTVWWGIPGAAGSSRTDHCANNKIVMENFCSNQSRYLVDIWGAEGYTCLGTCEDGICIEPNATQPVFTCDDSDGGLDYAIKGTINGTYSNGSPFNFTDSCLVIAGTNVIEEWYCNDNIKAPSGNRIPCNCIDGACV